MNSPFLYLLHFDKPRHHACHYLGCSEDIIARLAAHANGQGSCLTKALYEDHEGWTLAALYVPRAAVASIRFLERRAKERHNAAAYCPLCRPGRFQPPLGTIHYPTPDDLNSINLRITR